MDTITMDITTKEQSQRLMAAGLDPQTHDARWELLINGDYNDVMGQSVSIRDNLFSFQNGYVIPAWSFNALFHILGRKIKEIQVWHDESSVDISASSPGFSASATSDNPIEALVQIYEKAVKSGYIK